MSREVSDLKKAMALDLAKWIPTGHANAITRSQLVTRTCMDDRTVRELIEIARDEGQMICNDQDGKGYYLAETIEEIERQHNRDRARALSVLKRLKASRRALKEAGNVNISDLACAYKSFNERLNKDVLERPAVFCTASGCAACAFNPAEQKRRLKNGKWVQHGRIRTLHFKRRKS